MRLLLVLLVLVSAACSGAAEGATGPGPSQPRPMTTPSPKEAAGPPEDLIGVQTAFCHDYLPFLAVILDVDTVTLGDAIGTGNEDEVLAMIDVNRGVLDQTRTLMKIYEDSFAALGEEAASETAAETAERVADIEHARDGQALAVALDPAALDAVLPSEYCEPVISQDFGRGYFDGWLLRPKALDNSEYLHGYKTGRDEGWRVEPATAT